MGLSALAGSLSRAIDYLAPENTFQPKKLKPPWVDAEIKLLTSKRDDLLRKFNKKGSRAIYDEFLRQSQLVEEQTERS